MCHNDKVGLMAITMMCMSNWYSEATFYEIEEVFDPGYLNLDPDDKDAWKIYMEKVAGILS